VRLIESIFARFGYFKNPVFEIMRSTDEIQKMKDLAAYVEDHGYRVFNYAPGVGIKYSKLANAVEYIGKRGFITVFGTTVFGAMSPVHESSNEVADRRRSTFKLVQSDE